MLTSGGTILSVDAVELPIEIYGGRVYTHIIERKDASGNPIPFDADDTFAAQVRRFAQSDEVLAEFTVDDSEKVSAAKVVLSLDGDQTAALDGSGFWDVVWMVGGTTPVVLIPNSRVRWKLGVTRDE